MKKNEIFGWVVYIAMLAIAIGIGFGVIQPLVQGQSDVEMVMNPILLIVIAIIAGLLANAAFIELGHILGAKIGGYGIYSVNILYFCFARHKENQKFSFSFHSFDGLTGETCVYPKNIEKNKPQAMVYMPLVLFLVEVIALSVLIGIFDGARVDNPSLISWEVFCITILTVGAMLYLYDIFPAALDSKNDGYLLTVLTNKTNRIAYNQLLLGNYQIAMGLPTVEVEVYDAVTDFTYNVNDITLYRKLEEGKLVEAAEIANKAVLSKESISERLLKEAACQKLSLYLLAGEKEKGEEAYKEMSMEAKKYASNMNSAPALRAHLCISGLLDKSYQETLRALDNGDRIIRKSPQGKRGIEEKLILEALHLIHEANPDWDLSAYNVEEPVTDKKEEPPAPEEDTSKEEQEGK